LSLERQGASQRLQDFVEHRRPQISQAVFNIDVAIQEGRARVDIVLLTHRAIEKNVDAALKKIERLKTVVGKVTRIRLEELL